MRRPPRTDASRTGTARGPRRSNAEREVGVPAVPKHGTRRKTPRSVPASPAPRRAVNGRRTPHEARTATHLPDGPLNEPRYRPTSTRTPELSDRRDGGADPRRTVHQRIRPKDEALSARRPKPRSRRLAESVRFPPNGFTHSLTLFSKSFSPFPRGTCSLSVSRRYVALDGVYHPFWAAFPNNPTLGKRLAGPGSRLETGFSPSTTRPSRRLGREPARGPDGASLNYNSHHPSCREVGDFQFEPFPASLAVTEGILVSFFSSAY